MGDNDTFDANARLIAAAPELLAALIACEQAMTKYFSDLKYMRAEPLGAARMAISKAGPAPINSPSVPLEDVLREVAARASGKYDPRHFARAASATIQESPNVVPPDPDEMNDARAELAKVALGALLAVTETSPEDAMLDLLSNLMHLCDRTGTNFGDQLHRAKGNYEAETMKWNL